MNALQCPVAMKIRTSFARLCGAGAALLLTAFAAGQVPGSALAIRSIAEVESRSLAAGKEVVKLIPADRVVPGDRVIYTLEVRNTGATALDAPIVTHPVPEHMRYIADTAVGPGADVSYSVDGGHTFRRAEELQVLGVEGRPRPAMAADYTDIRWQLKNSLKANSVAFVRFRALVK